MNSCNHATWLQLAEYTNKDQGKDFVITDTDRFQRLVEGLPRPSEQRPYFLFFFGGKRGTKAAALKELFRHNNIKRDKSSGIASLRIDNASLETDTPMIFADANKELQINPAVVPSLCHATKTHTVAWSCGNGQTAADIIFTRVLLPACHVFILFADDFDNIDEIHRTLSRWSTLYISKNKPRLVVVYTTPCTQIQDLRAVIAEKSVRTMFSDISSLSIDKDISQFNRYRHLGERLKQEASVAAQARTGSHELFSATHVHALCNSSLRHAVSNIVEPFDTIKATRTHTKYDGLIIDHILEFLKAGTKHAMTYDDSTQYVASALFMDAYPPGSHRKYYDALSEYLSLFTVFEPQVMFMHLYHADCLGAYNSFYGPTDLAQSQARRTQRYFCQQFKKFKEWDFENEDASSAQLHAVTSQRTRIHWRAHKSKKTCLFCLVRIPQHTSTCGHSICDTCLKIFGQGLPYDGQIYQLTECFLCRKGSLEAVIKPPTCGVRMIGIDGGGTRGVLPIEFLQLLQTSIGPECRLADFFDLAVGTSAGGLIVLAMFLCRWDINKCSQVFESFVKKFFGSSKRSKWDKLQRLLRGCLQDGIYSSQDLERCLQEHFGSQNMFDTSRPSGLKVAVIASQDGQSKVFANYNAIGHGYGYERTNDAAVWEAARATSAAPLYGHSSFQLPPADFKRYFPPFYHKEQASRDGGLTHNCPIRISLCEKECLWTHSGKLDTYISLGTGITKDPFIGSPKHRSWVSLMIDPLFSCVLDVYKSFSASTQSHLIYEQTLDQLPKDQAKKSFRFDIELNKAPEIDDTTILEELKGRAHMDPLGESTRRDAVTALLASAFYLELDCIPTFDRGRYRCEGTIRCRNSSRAVIQSLARLYPNFPLVFSFSTASSLECYALAVTTHLNANLATLKEEDICQSCQRYIKAVVFYVQHPAENITISLRTTEINYQEISGFPQSTAYIMHEQGLDAKFGTADHQAHGAFLCHNCDQVGPRQKRPLLHPSLPEVKRVCFRE